MEKEDFQAEGIDFRSYIERTGLGVASLDRLGQPVIDLQRIKLVTGIYPHINAVTGTVIDVYIEALMAEDDTVNWQGPYTYTVGTDDKVNVYVTGRFIGVRFEEQEAVEWSLESYTLELMPLGLR